MNTAKIVRTAGIAIASLLVAGGVVAVTAYAAGVNLVPKAAASPSPSATPGKVSAYCDKFNQHLASDLKTSQSNLQSQLNKAAQQTIDDAVKAGDLTQAQADRLKSQLTGQKSFCSGPVAGLGRPDRGEGMVFMQATMAAAAATVNLTPDQLRQQLMAGKTLAQLAPAGMTEDQFKSGFAGNLKKELDPQVKSGKLTQAQEDKFLQGAPKTADLLWNHGLQRATKPNPKASPSPTS